MWMQLAFWSVICGNLLGCRPAFSGQCFDFSLRLAFPVLPALQDKIGLPIGSGFVGCPHIEEDSFGALDRTECSAPHS